MAQAPRTSRVTLLATLALLAITASWGSTFFLIHDLLDRVPVLDFLAVRFTIASVAILLLSPRAIGRLSPERRRQALVLGGSVRRGADPADRRPRAHGGQRLGLHHRDVRRRHSPVRGGAAAHPDRGDDLARRAARDRRARRTHPRRRLQRPRTGVRRGADPGRRAHLRAAHRRPRRLVGLAGRARHVDHPVHGDRRDLRGRRGPERDRAAGPGRRLAGRSSTWRWSPARPHCSARPGRRRTCRPPGPRSS